ncbi:MAG: PIN domain-containing protein [Candidatus Aenigmarchaeota archaeon]|nr:PIN domain-containing protein [Candidatus Aenigmarchaeota archaeon]
MDENDRLRKSAEKLLATMKGSIWTSVVTVVEIVLVAKRRGATIQELMRDLIQITQVRGATPEQLMQAARYIDEGGAGVFDAFHAALCEGKIVSSDTIYDKLGLSRVSL